MHLYSWNVNGIRAAVKKGFVDTVNDALDAPDVLCLQETKAQDDQVKEALEGLDGYHIYSNSAEKKGYSGVAVLTKAEPSEVRHGMGIEEHDNEGRVLSLRFADFWLVTVYTPNSQNELKRLDYRKTWDKAFLDHLKSLEETAPVVCCGDLNVAHQEIDIARPKSNYNKSAGYTQDEIDGLSRILENGFIDTYRTLHPETVKYSWWSFRANARAKNIGWRIDYFLTSASLKSNVKSAVIRDEVMGSDHCPIGLELNF
jgi:exodeoxyribonuclease-3